MSMEFVMRGSLNLPKTIDFNFEELKNQLEKSLELYTGLVVTEDSIKSAKEDRAKLNKLREALETKRKEVKKECMAPYTEFESKVRVLTQMIDKPILAIDGQLKCYEEKRRAEKREAVMAIYDEHIGELRSLLPFERLWNDTWYNVGVSIKKIQENIVSALEKTASDLQVLSTVESEYSEHVKLKYIDTLDLNAALAERARLQEKAERLRAYEEQRALSAKAAEEQTPPPASNTSETDDNHGVGETMQETVYLLRFECQVTRDQAAELSRFLKDRNISYRRI